MKKLSAFCMLFFMISCMNPERKCADFKTGKFKTEVEIKGIKKPVFFTRTENFQIETFNGKTDTSSVRWINDCEFVTRKLYPKTMQEEKYFNVKILTTNKNSCVVEYSEVGKSTKMTSVVTKLE